MDEHQCTNCGAALPRTGTYCLACDTVVVNTEGGGLSVGEPHVVQHGRPLVGVAVIVACLAFIGGTGYAIYALWESHVNTSASTAALAGIKAIVHAERGTHASSCHAATAVINGPSATTLTECEAIFGADPDQQLTNLRAANIHRHGKTASVEVQGTWVTSTGTKAFDRRVNVVQSKNQWWLQWDGKPITAS